MRREQADSFREMTEYYTMWVHQIKTPIAAMRLRLDAEDTALSHSLKSELQRTEQYVEMVLGYLRTQSDETDYVIASCDIDRLVRDTAKRFSMQFIGRKISFVFHPGIGRILTDEKWFQFVLEQLLSNALKYTPPGGTVEIGGETDERTGEGAYLYIRDNGIGIAPEDLPRIFERGFTGYQGRTDKRATGIGLYLCRRICSQLGHTITAESVPGKGTTVKIGLSRKERIPE
ncbi:MAG: sensor histidine kinase [Eubacteriales bacterium]